MVALNIGVLLLAEQPLDVIGPQDVVISASRPYINGFESFGAAPSGLSKKGIDIVWHQIGESLSPVPTMSNYTLGPSTQCDPSLDLDILLVGGPAPDYKVPGCFAELIINHVNANRTLWATCTGAVIPAQLGLLDGKDATITHPFLPYAKGAWPNVNWKASQAWERGGSVWTTDGAVGGMDLAWHWIKANYGIEIAEFVVHALNFSPRDIHGRFIAQGIE